MILFDLVYHKRRRTGAKLRKSNGVIAEIVYLSNCKGLGWNGSHREHTNDLRRGIGGKRIPATDQRELNRGGRGCNALQGKVSTLVADLGNAAC